MEGGETINKLLSVLTLAILFGAIMFTITDELDYTAKGDSDVEQILNDLLGNESKGNGCRGTHTIFYAEALAARGMDYRRCGIIDANAPTLIDVIVTPSGYTCVNAIDDVKVSKVYLKYDGQEYKVPKWEGASNWFCLLDAPYFDSIMMVDKAGNVNIVTYP